MKRILTSVAHQRLDSFTNYDNLLIVQTLSKSRALAGLRVDYASGHRHLIEVLERVNCFNSYPVDRLAVAGAVAAFSDKAQFETCRVASSDHVVN